MTKYCLVQYHWFIVLSGLIVIGAVENAYL